MSTLVSTRAHLREIFQGRTIAAMLHLGESAGSNKRVNVLKKVKVKGVWKFCPAVVEPSGRLKDRVRVGERTEIHYEGVYYIEWRESSQRRRQAVTNRCDVLERARLKALELDAKKAGMEIALDPVRVIDPPVTYAAPQRGATSAGELPTSTMAAAIRQGIESYFSEIVGTALQSHLARIGGMPATTAGNNSTGNGLPLVCQGPNPPAKALEESADSSKRAASGENLLASAIESFLKDIAPPQREQKTYDEYRLVLHRFRDTCGKTNLHEINRDDCLSFMRHLYSSGNEARTVYNRISIVLQLLKLNGIKDLLTRRDMPKYVENVREMYEPDDVEALFKACKPDERVLYLFFLLTGERDKEVRYTSWSDIDFGRQCVRVTSKKRLGFKPKDKEEREVPVPSLLLAALQEYKARQSGQNPHNLVFPTSQGRADRKFENKLKRIARRAGLNCGHCESKFGNKCSEGPHCSKWFLHKFRHTFATRSLESGMSIRVVQEWLGHSDLASTMVYLKFVRRKDIHKLLDTSEMADLAARSLGLNDSRKANLAT